MLHCVIRIKKKIFVFDFVPRFAYGYNWSMLFTNLSDESLTGLHVAANIIYVVTTIAYSLSFIGQTLCVILLYFTCLLTNCLTYARRHYHIFVLYRFGVIPYNSFYGVSIFIRDNFIIFVCACFVSGYTFLSSLSIVSAIFLVLALHSKSLARVPAHWSICVFVCVWRGVCMCVGRVHNRCGVVGWC